MNYETIFASLPDAVCVVDRKGQIVAIDPALERLLGWRLSNLSQRPLAESLTQMIPDPAQALNWTVALGQALDHGQATDLTLPASISAADDAGTSVTVTGAVVPWLDGTGEILGALVTFHPTAVGPSRDDIRERFAAMVAHELSSPLANISVATDRLSDPGELDDPQRLRLLQILRTETHRLRRLLGQFLTDPALPEPMALPNTIITLRPLLRRMIHIFELQGRSQQVMVQIPADIPFVYGDAGRIQEVLNNLADYALRLAPPGSPVSVTVAEVGPSVVVTVSAATKQQTESESAAVTLQVAQATIQALGSELTHSYDPEAGIQYVFTLQAVEGARDGQE